MTADNRADPQSPPSPTRVYDKQLPTPPTSDDDEQSQQDNSRSRSSSHSSRSSSSRNSNMLTGSGTLEDSITSPSLFDTDPIFPRSHSMPEGVVHQLASPPGTPIASVHQRSHTSNDLARIASSSSSTTGSGIPRPISSAQHARTKSGMSTPLSATITARQRSSPLVDMQAEQALRRSRPAPPKSRRQSGDRFGGGNLPSSNSTGSIASLDGRRSRQSSDEYALSPRIMSPNDGLTSPLFATSLDAMHEEDAADSSFDDVYARPRSRQTSGMRGASPLFETSPPPHASMQGAMFPPQSPLLDDTSFHTIPISPHELRNTMDDFRGNANEHESHILHTRPVSTVSIGSEVTALQELVQTLQQELAKKNQDLEAQRSDSYSLLMEKESLLEEIKIELISKRKEEKELRSKEKINLNQIATLEAQTASFRDERDKQKMAYQNVSSFRFFPLASRKFSTTMSADIDFVVHSQARKQYEEQCSE